MRRTASVGAAVAKSRDARLRRIERGRLSTFRYLRRRDPDGHAALVAVMRRVIEVTQQAG